MMSLTYTALDGVIGEKMKKFAPIEDDFLRVDPGQCIFPSRYALYGDRIRDMEIRNDDIWLASIPRCGSHWAQEMVWCIGNGFDYKKAEELLIRRCPFLEGFVYPQSMQLNSEWSTVEDSVTYVENQASPRYIKTHLPWDLLPQQLHQKKPKIVYIARNPKDACVSFYHYMKFRAPFTWNLEEYADIMLDGHGIFTAPFWKNVLQFWEHKDDLNVLFLTFEEMKNDQAGVIRRTADFLGKAVTEEQVAGLCEHLKFSNMARNPSVIREEISASTNSDDPNANFLRKGVVGDWRNSMTEELSHRFDVWTDEHTRGTGLKFKLDYQIVNNE